ncbi:hypothetical protein BT69DRAFT_1297065 [Atractiella rhizophila]|nr:hypothetical protein BT69DRAFT_1297065 [Atractiella rhizophila]
MSFSLKMDDTDLCFYSKDENTSADPFNASSFEMSLPNQPHPASAGAEITTLSGLLANTYNSFLPSFCATEEAQIFTPTEAAAIGRANVATLLKVGNMCVVGLVTEVTLKNFRSILPSTDVKPVVEPPTVHHTPSLFKPDGTIPIPPNGKRNVTLSSKKNELHRHWLVGEDCVRVQEDASIRLLSRNLLDEIVSASQYRNSKWRHLLAEQNAIDIMTWVLEKAFNEQKKKWKAADGLPKKFKKSVKDLSKAAIR